MFILAALLEVIIIIIVIQEYSLSLLSTAHLTAGKHIRMCCGFLSSRGIAPGLSLSNAVDDLSLTVYQVKLQHILGASKDGKTRFSAHKLCSFHGTYFLSGE